MIFGFLMSNKNVFVLLQKALKIFTMSLEALEVPCSKYCRYCLYSKSQCLRHTLCNYKQM